MSARTSTDGSGAAFQDALAGLCNGDFTRLSPVFAESSTRGAARAQIVRWHEAGLFANHPEEAAEALTCACFLGEIGVAKHFIAHGLDAAGGMRTGMNAFHWAANRAQLEAVRLLVRHRAPLETRNMYGGTVLGGAVWAAVHETKRDHFAVIEELLRAGADVHEAELPSGDARIDELLRRFGAP
jgi:hypothetical protein